MVGVGELELGAPEAEPMGPACECGRGPTEPAEGRLQHPVGQLGPVEPLERPAWSRQRPGSRPRAGLF
eukprot:7592497-Alexandrium_andersonii.AAC.1